MKKLLFFINTLEGGGAEQVLTNVANSFSEQYDVTVMTLRNGGVHENRLSEKVNYKSIIKIKNKFIRRLIEYIICFILPPAITHKLFIGNDYDCQIAFLEGVPTKLISVAKTKKYAWVHIDLVNTFGIEKVHRSMQKHIDCYKKYDKIICVSETVKEAFSRRFGITDNVIVKYNIVDDLLIREKATEKIERTEKTRIVSVGRLAKQKGYDRLLDVAGRLSKEGFDFELVLVGKGEEEENLKKQADSLGISDCVKFVGFVENPYRYMQSADFLVFPSRAEGYSTVVTEAVILGKPIVVSDCSGMREILGDSEYGIVTDSDEDLYNGVKDMITDKSLRDDYAKKASIRAKDFSRAKRVEELTELF